MCARIFFGYSWQPQSSHSKSISYGFLLSDEIIALCRWLSESIMSVIGLTFRLLQVASTILHVSPSVFLCENGLTVSGLLQQ